MFLANANYLKRYKKYKSKHLIVLNKVLWRKITIKMLKGDKRLNNLEMPNSLNKINNSRNVRV